MTAHPTRTTGRCLWLSAFFAVVITTGAHASPKHDLQALGARIAEISARLDNAPPSSAQLADLRRELAMLQSSLDGSGNVLLPKYQAVAFQLAMLEHDLAHPRQAADDKPGRRIEREVVSSRHGGKCDTALGLTEAAAVQTIIGVGAGGLNDAWLRFEPSRDATYVFSTRSSGPDPALEVFVGGCRKPADAENDDAAGLDAALAVQGHRGQAVFLHLTNSAQGGAVTIGATTANETISGTIMDGDTEQPIPYAFVNARLTTLNYYYTTNADQFGHFQVAVTAGSYYVYASASGRVAKVYPDAACRYGSPYYFTSGDCDLAAATPVVVAAGAAVTGIGIALDGGAQLAGYVRDNNNQPVAQALISLFDGVGSALDNHYSDSLGRYSFTAVPAGSYKLEAVANGYGSQMYDHVTCTGPLKTQCDLTQAASATVVSQDLTSLNFNLPVLASIQGTVTGPASYQTQVCVLDSQGNPINVCGQTDSNGNYKAGPLPLGTYYAYAQAAGFFSQINAGIDCGVVCAISLPSATALVITQQGQALIANFQLHALPTLHGHVQDAVSGFPLANVAVYASVQAPAGYATGNTTTDASGNYTLQGMPAGSYYVLAVSNDHLDRIYPDVACEQFNPSYYYPNTACDVSSAVQLTIAPGSVPPAFDFSLPPAAAISGHATTRIDAGSDLPAASVEVDVYNGAGALVSSATTDALGTYVVNDLPPGNYYAEAGSAYYWQYAYITQVWQGIDCFSACAATSGTPLPVQDQATLDGVDFNLTRRDAIVGKVVDDAGHPLAGVIVDLFDATNGNYLQSGVSNLLGYYAAPGNVGYSYFVATEAGGGHVDQVYAGISCPLGPAYFGNCPLLGATPVGLNAASVQPQVVNFALYSADTVFASNFER